MDKVDMSEFISTTLPLSDTHFTLKEKPLLLKYLNIWTILQFETENKIIIDPLQSGPNIPELNTSANLEAWLNKLTNEYNTLITMAKSTNLTSNSLRVNQISLALRNFFDEVASILSQHDTLSFIKKHKPVVWKKLLDLTNIIEENDFLSFLCMFPIESFHDTLKYSLFSDFPYPNLLDFDINSPFNQISNSCKDIQINLQNENKFHLSEEVLRKSDLYQSLKKLIIGRDILELEFKTTNDIVNSYVQHSKEFQTTNDIVNCYVQDSKEFQSTNDAVNSNIQHSKDQTRNDKVNSLYYSKEFQTTNDTVNYYVQQSKSLNLCNDYHDTSVVEETFIPNQTKYKTENFSKKKLMSPKPPCLSFFTSEDELTQCSSPSKKNTKRAKLIDDSDSDYVREEIYQDELSRDRKRRGFPIPIKEYLVRWLLRHKDNPYPSIRIKEKLARNTGLSLNQVEDFLVNGLIFIN
jgi:hypothetical protein